MILGGNPDLRPKIPANLARLAVRQQPQTVSSRNGRARLRMLPVRLGGATLLVTTSLAGLYKTADRLEIILGAEPPARADRRPHPAVRVIVARLPW